MEHPLASRRRDAVLEPDREFIHLNEPRTERLMDTLSCPTTRRVLHHLYDQPQTASELAGRIECSLQNIQYHLQKLEDRGLIEVADTTLSEKGRRMDVYAPSTVPVIVAGPELESERLPMREQ